MTSRSTQHHHHLTSNGTNIHYISSYSPFTDPRAPLAILLHGLGGSTETFRDLLPSIPSGYQTISVDIEGFGKSALNTSKPLSFVRYVEDLHDLVAHLQEYSTANGTTSPYSSNGSSSVDVSESQSDGSSSNPILLIGHSLGAIISLHYAAKHPSGVAGLLLLGVGRSIRTIPAAQQRMRDLATTARSQGMLAVSEIAVSSNFPADRDNQASHVDAVRQAVAACDPQAYAATAEVVASDEHCDPEYSKITCPAVFVAGDRDVISPPQRSVDVSSLLGGKSEVVVLESGHQMILQDLTGVKKALARLLAML